MTEGTNTQRDIEFRSGTVTVRGWLRTPEGAGPHALVILAHGLGGLKEWTIPDVAASLNDAGIAALAFDYRNFGDSEGEPREEVDHAGQIEDWRNAVTFATTLPDIDTSRIGLWGTSLGARNVLAAAALDHRIRCVYAQVPPLSASPEMVAMMLGATSVEEADRIVNDDLHDRASGLEPKYVYFPTDANTEHGSYWATFGEAEKRNWNPRVTVRSFAPALADDITPLLSKIAPTPVLLVVADGDVFCPPDASQAAFELLGEPKELMVVNGHHYSVYTEWKDRTTAAARDWFIKHLRTA